MQLLLFNCESLERNLTQEEFNRATSLIYEHPTLADRDCIICKNLPGYVPGQQDQRAIYDTNVCQGHAFYCLATQK